jgi:hypothetical protein
MRGMIAKMFSRLVGIVLLLAGLFLLMFNDLGKLTWMVASLILMGAGAWLVKQSTR